MDTLKDVGYVWYRKALSAKDISGLTTGISWSSVSGARDIALDLDLQRRLTQLAEPFLPNANIVRLTAFNKTAESNWTLPWHQDRIIVAREQNDDPRFKNWTRKGDYWHCEPPIEYLENMVFARIYLDEAGPDTGDLQIAQGSHKYGKVLSSDIETVLSKSQIHKCTGEVGDVLLIKALILHRSGKSNQIGSRRALRVDFSANEKVISMATQCA